MHYALTIRTAPFTLKNSDCKNFPNHGPLPCPMPCRGSHPGPQVHRPTTASNPARLLNLPGLEPMQHLSQLPTCDFLVLKLSVYTESIKTTFKAVLLMGTWSIQYVVVFKGHVYSIKSAPNSRHLKLVSPCGLIEKFTSRSTGTFIKPLKRSRIDLTLIAYQKHFGDPENKPMVTTKQGEHSFLPTTTPQTTQPTLSLEPSQMELMKSFHMKPKHYSYFRVDLPDLDDIILFQLNYCQVDHCKPKTPLHYPCTQV